MGVVLVLEVFLGGFWGGGGEGEGLWGSWGFWFFMWWGCVIMSLGEFLVGWWWWCGGFGVSSIWVWSKWLSFEKGTLSSRKKENHLLLSHPYFIFPSHTPHSQQDGELFQTCVKDSKCTEH